MTCSPVLLLYFCLYLKQQLQKTCFQVIFVRTMLILFHVPYNISKKRGANFQSIIKNIARFSSITSRYSHTIIVTFSRIYCTCLYCFFFSYMCDHLRFNQQSFQMCEPSRTVPLPYQFPTSNFLFRYKSNFAK